MATNTALEKTRDTAGRAGADMRAEIDSLSSQIERLAGDLSRLGRSSFRSARSNASDGLDVLSRKGAGLSRDIGRELSHVEDRAALAVRERPLQTVGVAVAIGFLLGAILRR